MTALLLAAEDGGGDPGLLPLLLVVLLGIATVLLIRNMSGRIKRLPREFPDPEQPSSAATPPDRPDGTA